MDIRHIVNAPDSSPSRNPKVEKGQAPVVIPGPGKTGAAGAADQVEIDRELRSRIAELTKASMSSPDIRQDRVVRLRAALGDDRLHSGEAFAATAAAMVGGELLMVAGVDLNELR